MIYGDCVNVILNSVGRRHLSRRYLMEFDAAVRSECAIDEHYRHVLGVNDKDFVGLPRPAKWISFAKNNPFVLVVFYHLLKLVWFAGGGVVYFLFQMSFYFVRSLFVPCKEFDCGVNREYALGFSRRAMDVVGEISLGRNPDCWVLFPWVRKKKHGDFQNVIDILELARFSDFAMAFALSAKALYKVGLISVGGESRFLQTYIAYQWFLARLTLEKLNADYFVIAEHHDRWAVLADCLVSGKLNFGSSLVVVQHGVESTLKAVHKLSNVSRLYVYDESSLRIFKENIISSCGVGGVCFYRYSIDLKLLDRSVFPCKTAALIVGHPSVESLHIGIYESLLKGRDINVIYKPHPTVRESQEVRRAGWFVWRTKEDFPLVDIVISYPSTLVDEYSLAGVGAVVHPYAITLFDAADYLEKLSAVLDVVLSEENGRGGNG